MCVVPSAAQYGKTSLSFEITERAAPPISGLGTSTCFKLMVEAIGDVDFNTLQAQTYSAGDRGRGARQLRAGANHALQHVSGGLDQWSAAARDQHRRRPSDDGIAEHGPAAQHDHQVDRGELSAEAGQQGRTTRDLLNNPMSAFVVGVVLVFFVLAGLYESWSLPWSVILVVPMCLLSALVGLALAGYDVNIFLQVGFVVLVGLAAKNAILIVQFAHDREAEGASLFDAAEEAARERLRPILMTSFAFILGVFPLVISEGAGHEMRRTLGMAVFAGMIGVILFGIFLTPLFYYVVRRFTSPKATLAPHRRRKRSILWTSRPT